MRKILIFMLIFLICLCACETTPANNEKNNKEPTTVPVDTFSPMDYSWFKNGDFISDHFTELSGNKFDYSIQFGNEARRGEYLLHLPYKNGTPMDSSETYLLWTIPLTTVFNCRLSSEELMEASPDARPTLKICLRYLPEGQKVTDDPISAFESLDLNEKYTIDRDSVYYNGDKKDVFVKTQIFPDGKTIEITKSIFDDDIFIEFTFDKKTNFDLQDFLDGFELRPIILKTEL